MSLDLVRGQVKNLTDIAHQPNQHRNHAARSSRRFTAGFTPHALTQ